MTLHTAVCYTLSRGLSKYGRKNKGRRGGQRRDEVGLDAVLIHQKSNLSLKVGGRKGD